MNDTAEAVSPKRLPPWLRRPIQTDQAYAEVQEVLRKNGLHTVCEDSKCPNRHECWNHGTATIMILGNICTRDCRFCNVATGQPDGLDLEEPLRVADAVEKMGLSHVVITSVTRDDLPDGGADIFAQTIVALKERMPGVTVEVLTPDFSKEHLCHVLDAGPDVFNHNIETVERLQGPIRKAATYERSMEVLRNAAGFGDGVSEMTIGPISSQASSRRDPCRAAQGTPCRTPSGITRSVCPTCQSGGMPPSAATSAATPTTSHTFLICTLLESWLRDHPEPLAASSIPNCRGDLMEI